MVGGYTVAPNNANMNVDDEEEEVVNKHDKIQIEKEMEFQHWFL